MIPSLTGIRPTLFATIRTVRTVRRVASMLMLAGMLGNPMAVIAADPVKTDSEANPDAGKSYATVWRIRGEVGADTGVAGGTRQLKLGDTVHVGERVRAAPSGEMVLKTEDAGIVAVRPGTEFMAERFAADGKASDRQTLRIIVGSLRVITGWIGRINKAGHRIVTPTATIGIRGTDHEPYVLSADMAAYKQGTYDKVNRGATTLAAAGQDLDIGAGRVGFARASASAPGSEELVVKGLMTILFPVLLDKVPAFYVPGKFDAELDRYARNSDKATDELLKQKQKSAGVDTTQACEPTAIAKDWLNRFDRAIVGKDAKSIIALFAPDVSVRATVRGANDAMTSVDLTRDELAQSTITAMKGLKDFKQRRVSLDASMDEPKAGTACGRVSLRSVVIEQGNQAGKPYRFESLEEFVLESQNGKWLAVKAQSTQR